MTTSIARLRAIEAIQVIGEASAGLNQPAPFQILTYVFPNDLFGEIPPPQDTQHDAEEFPCAGGRVKAPESGLIPLLQRQRSARPAQLASAFSVFCIKDSSVASRREQSTTSAVA